MNGEGIDCDRQVLCVDLSKFLTTCISVPQFYSGLVPFFYTILATEKLLNISNLSKGGGEVLPLSCNPWLLGLVLISEYR